MLVSPLQPFRSVHAGGSRAGDVAGARQQRAPAIAYLDGHLAGPLAGARELAGFLHARSGSQRPWVARPRGPKQLRECSSSPTMAARPAAVPHPPWMTLNAVITMNTRPSLLVTTTARPAAASLRQTGRSPSPADRGDGPFQKLAPSTLPSPAQGRVSVPPVSADEQQ